MKRLVSLILYMGLCLSLIACGSNGGSVNKSSKNDNSKYVGVYWDHVSHESIDYANVIFLLGDGTYKHGFWSNESLGTNLERLKETYKPGGNPNYWKDEINKFLNYDRYWMRTGGSGSWWVIDDNIIELTDHDRKMEIKDKITSSNYYQLIPGYEFIKEYIR